jgi:hypothetical protein
VEILNFVVIENFQVILKATVDIGKGTKVGEGFLPAVKVSGGLGHLWL